MASVPLRPVAHAALVVLLLQASPRPAHAHPLVDRAREATIDARFQDALDLLASAERARDLSRDDVVALLEARALAHQALGDQAAVESDLDRLVAVAPEHTFSAEAPPDVTEAFARAKARSPGALDVRLAVSQRPGGVEVAASVANDRGLARETVVYGRARSGSWESARNGPLFVRGTAGGRVEHYAVAIGPGGAVLAQAGSRADPRAVVVVGSPASTRRETHETSDAPAHWLWFAAGAGAMLAVVAIVLLVASATSDSDRITAVTTFEAP